MATSTLRLPNHIPVIGYGLRNVFPGLTFDQPVALAAAPGETNRLFVVQRTGSIYVITNLAQPTKTLFLDLSWQLQSGNVESGLLGLTFHPGFATNGYFFVYRTMLATTAGAANRYHDVVSRFSVSAADANRAPPESEVPLLMHYDESDTHNAGDLKFGPDGYLYISIGERFNRDPSLPDQTPIDRDLHGSILRIDVDRRPGNLPPNPHPASTPNYSIPADNPFVGATRHHGLPVDPTQVRTELYATGLRNPWRMAFDPFTGALYVGDVGEASAEEIDMVLPGADYGWPYREGFGLTGYSPPAEFTPVPPLHAYGRGSSGGTNGNCVIGGLIYSGQAMPWLRGRYLFGDYRSGYVWSLTRGESGATVEQLTATTIGLSSFGTDPRDGEVLLTHLHEGIILKLVYAPPETVLDVPATLAETGVFADVSSLTPNPGVVPYEVNVSFWSDEARKRRWFCVPELDGTISFNATNAWAFPTGAVWIKHFDLELTNGWPASARRLETRVLVNTAEGFYGLTYRWDDAQTNATLVPAEGMEEPFLIRDAGGTILREQTWHYPSRAECMNCHTKWGGRVLGFNTAQLNRPVAYGGVEANQIQALGAAGYLAPVPAPEADLPALAAATNLNAPLEFRVRSYFQANCSACHVPGGPTLTPWDARLGTPLADAHILGGVVAPGRLLDSTLYLRLLNVLPLMPPIGTSVLNTNGIDLVARWILGLPAAPWSYLSIGDVVHDGGSTVADGVYEVGGSGESLAGTNDAFQFLHQPFAESAAQFIGRLRSADNPDPTALAGIMFRDGTGPSDPFVMAACWGDGQAAMLFRESAGMQVQAASFEPVALPQWLRLVRREAEFDAWRSDDGSNWLHLGTITWPDAAASLEAGFAVNSGSRTEFNNAVFDNLSSLSITLTSPIPASVRQPADVTLGASVRWSGRDLARVEYYDGDSKIGETAAEPHLFTASNLWAGVHPLSVRAVDVAGAWVASPSAPVTVRPFPTQAGMLGETGGEGDTWPGYVGTLGYALASQVTNLPPSVDLSMQGADVRVWEGDSQDPRALLKPGSNLGVAAAWTAEEEFTISLRIRDGQLRRLGLYFLDWDTNAERVERVDFIDPANGRVVTSQILRNFSAGIFVSAFVRGAVDLRVVTLAGPDAVLSGLFLDDYPDELPTVAVLSPVEGSTIELPASLLLEADASDPTDAIRRVEYYLDGRLIGIRTNAPYRVQYSALREGVHTVVARAYDSLLGYQDSVPVSFTAKLPLARAIFLREDDQTRGNWVSQYGRTGWLLPPLTNKWPGALFQAMAGGSMFPFYGTDPDYLQMPDSPDRILPLLYSYSTISYELGLADGNSWQVALYFYDDAIYPEVVRVLSQKSGELLDSRAVTNGLGSRYLLWNVQGDVTLVISNPAPGAVQARVSGLFLDPFTNPPPQVSLLLPAADLEVGTPARVLLSATASAAEGVREMQFHTEQATLGLVRQPPYDFLWEYPPAGNYQVFARAVSASGAAQDSPAVNVTVRPATPAAARFIAEDLVTGGNWQPQYGNEAYFIPGATGGSLLSPSVCITNDQDWSEYREQLWPNALRVPNGTARVLSFWLGDHWQLEMNLSDGRAHRVTLYNYAPGWTNPATILIRPTAGGEPLDSREIASQLAGTYLTWELQGDLTFEISAPDAGTAFVNGIFVDPVPDAYGDWRRRSFPPAGQLDPAISGEGADPDRDGYDNWSEFLLGNNPMSPESQGPIWLERGAKGSRLHCLSAKTADDASVKLQFSRDLKTWQDEPKSAPLETVDRGEQIERIYPVTSADAEPLFFRLRLGNP